MNIFKNKKLWKMIAVTIIALAIWRVGVFIQLPFINRNLTFIPDNMFGFLNAFSGGALAQFSIVALGISPYITASIVIQLLQMDIVPILKEWSEEGESGKQKLNQLTRYTALALAFVQALALTIGFSVRYYDNIFVAGYDPNAFTYVYLAIILTAGTAFILWLSDQITMKGIGNGASMMIVAGILSSIPVMFSDLIKTFLLADDAAFGEVMIFVVAVLMFIVVIVGVVYMEGAQRKIPIQYANRPGTAAFRGKSESNIPIKLNSASVIPVIFAATLMSLPMTVINLLEPSGATETLDLIFNQQRPIGFVLYVVLIFVFSFFYSFLQINPQKISENLQKQNAYIPGVRPGEETASFVSRVLFKITLLGATYLTIVASIPMIVVLIFPSLPNSVQIGGTSLLIVVGVALETAKQINNQIKEKEYKGFMD